MIYCQLRGEAELPLGAALRLGDVARLIAPEGAEDIPLPCPDREGVWRLDALLCARALRDACPGEEVSLLGAESCYIRRVKRHQPDPLRWLRAATACLILLLGSALGLSWFHSDVDMPAAQVMVYRLLTGQEPVSAATAPEHTAVPEPSARPPLAPEDRELLQLIHDKPGLRIMFDASKKATNEDILKAVEIIKAFYGIKEDD